MLIGFMGTGKTTIGRLLAGRLNKQFVDLDKKIEQEQNLPIKEIFKIHGEPHFRQLERDAVARVSKYTSTVIATGGGAVLNPDNRIRLMRNGIIISLSASVEAILARTETSAERPLLNGTGERAKVIAQILSQREKLYNQADFIVDTSCYSPQYVTEKIIIFLRQGGYLRGRSFD